MDSVHFFAVLLLLLGTSLFATERPSPGRTPRLSAWQRILPVTETDISRQNYLGDEACGACHSVRVHSYFQTAHHRTSSFPSSSSIAGSFANGKNILKTSNPALYFRMESKPEGFYQSSVWEISSVSSTRSERMDAVIGSGRKGQTYLYWRGSALFELPVSYWVDLGSWVNSPGYRDGIADFDRPVIPRCLECHATFAETVAGPPPPNQYKPASLVLGISCERCHGPGRAHREAMATTRPVGKIVNPAKLPRDRQIDICAQCHAGHGRPKSPAFSYVPGEPLSEYLELDQADPGRGLDVHGNQVGLLQASRCFQSSTEMSCSTCHDVHTTEREAAGYSSRCLKCHRPENCGEFSKLGEKIEGNCIDCHMPVEPSKLIISDSNAKQTRATVRNHWIKVYPETGTP